MKPFALAGAALAVAAFAYVHPLAAQQVSEVPSTAPVQRGRFDDFLHDAARPYGWGEHAATAVYAQLRDKPEGWNEDSDGMGRRFAASEGKAAISLTVRHGVAALLGVSAHPVRCATATGGARLVEAALEPIADRGCGGSVHPSIPRITARAASSFAPLLWHQPGFTSSKAATGLATGVVTSALLKVALAVVRPD